MRAAIDRRFPARLLADPNPVGHLGGDGATDRAMRADAFANDRAGAERAGRSRLRLANACERHRAERREASGADAGTAQKGAAIESGAIGGEAGERAAARLTV